MMISQADRKELARSPRKFYAFVHELYCRSAYDYRRVYKKPMPSLSLKPVPVKDGMGITLSKDDVHIITVTISDSIPYHIRCNFSIFGKNYSFTILKHTDAAAFARVVAFIVYHKLDGGGDEPIFNERWCSFFDLEGDTLSFSFSHDYGLLFPRVVLYILVKSSPERWFEGEATSYYVWYDYGEERSKDKMLHSVKFHSLSELKEALPVICRAEGLLRL